MIKETMKADLDTLLITDPCYLLHKEHWEHYCNLCFDEEYKKTGKESITISEYLQKYHNFGEVVGGSTGFGDWTNIVKDSETGEILGSFCADAGMVICCTMSDLWNYNPDRANNIANYTCTGGATIIHDYTGTITYTLEDSWAMITGEGELDINFTTLEQDEESEE